MEIMLSGGRPSWDAHRLVALVSCLMLSDVDEVLSGVYDALSDHKRCWCSLSWVGIRWWPRPHAVCRLKSSMCCLTRLTHRLTIRGACVLVGLSCRWTTSR